MLNIDTEVWFVNRGDIYNKIPSKIHATGVNDIEQIIHKIVMYKTKPKL